MYIVPVSHSRHAPLYSMTVLLSLSSPEDEVSGGQKTMGWIVGEVVLNSAQRVQVSDILPLLLFLTFLYTHTHAGIHTCNAMCACMYVHTHMCTHTRTHTTDEGSMYSRCTCLWQCAYMHLHCSKSFTESDEMFPLQIRKLTAWNETTSPFMLYAAY